MNCRLRLLVTSMFAFICLELFLGLCRTRNDSFILRIYIFASILDILVKSDENRVLFSLKKSVRELL